MQDLICIVRLCDCGTVKAQRDQGSAVMLASSYIPHEDHPGGTVLLMQVIAGKPHECPVRQQAHPRGPGAVQPPAGHDAPGRAPAGQRRKDALCGPPLREAEEVRALPALRRRAEEVHVLRSGMRQ